jgi:hypothetical protein
MLPLGSDVLVGLTPFIHQITRATECTAFQEQDIRWGADSPGDATRASHPSAHMCRTLQFIYQLINTLDKQYRYGGTYLSETLISSRIMTQVPVRVERHAR